MIRITPADKYFSLCVRERANYHCERCGNTPEPSGLHCSHYIGRGNWSVRFDPINVFAHCYGCHQRIGGDKHMFEEHYLEVFGMTNLKKLLERKESTEVGRIFRKLVGKKGTKNSPVTVHFRDENKLQKRRREDGNNDRLQFEAYNYE